MGKLEKCDLQTVLQSYQYTVGLNRDRWAWEFLRRDPNFQDIAYFYANKDDISRRTTHHRNVETIKLRRARPEAEKLGLSFFPNPDHNALKADIFWSEYRYPRPICVQVARAMPGDVDECFTPALARCQVTHFTGIDNREQFILRSTSCAIQIRSEGVSLLSEEPNKMRIMVDWNDNLKEKVRQINQAKNVYEAIEPDELKWSRRALQLRNALICLDAKTAGLSYWEMADIIYGKDHTELDKARGSRSLKDAMRRSLQLGQQLQDGGYQELLVASQLSRSQ